MTSQDLGLLREAESIAQLYVDGNSIDGVGPLGAGLINDTFLLTAGARRWVLQRINARVFPHPQRIMRNLAQLSNHLSRRPVAGLRCPAPVNTLDGRPWVMGRGAALWRLMEFVEGGRPLDGLNERGQAAEVGRLLGAFHLAVADLSPGAMATTLPGFHDTPGYVERLNRIRRGSAGQAVETRELAAFVDVRTEAVVVLERARRTARIPMRVTHGDPKLDNILFDPTGRRALALIDLDTVQPGLLHHDVGDCVRSCCNRGGESGRGDDSVVFDLMLFADLLTAYGAQVAPRLSVAEVGLLYDAVRLMPLELGVRFLTDHLEGDRWFRVASPGQNLAKARRQFALVEDIERKQVEIRAIIADCFGRLG